MRRVFLTLLSLFLFTQAEAQYYHLDSTKTAMERLQGLADEMDSAITNNIDAKVNLYKPNYIYPSYEDFYNAFRDSIRAIWVQLEGYIPPPDTLPPPDPTPPAVPLSFALNTTQGTTGDFILTWYCPDTTVVYEGINVGGTITYTSVATLPSTINIWTRSAQPAGTTRYYYLRARDSSVYSNPTIVLSATITNPVSGDAWYLSTSSSGNASGDSWTNARTYVGFNWNLVGAGDVVYLDGGATGDSLIYSISSLSISGTASQPITITRDLSNSSHNGKAVINRTANTAQGSVIDITGNYLVIERLQFMNTNNSTCSGGFQIVYLLGNYITFQYNTVYFACSKAVRIDGGHNIKILNNYMDTGEINTSGVADCLWIGSNGSNLEVAYNVMMMRNRESGSHKDNIQSYMWQTNGSTSYGTTKIHHNFFYSAITSAGDLVDNTILELSAIGGDWEVYDNVLVYSGTAPGRAMYLGNCNSEGADGVLFSAEVYNNTIYVGGSQKYAVSFEDTDSLIFKNNIVWNMDGSSQQIVNIGDNAWANYVDFDYNQYVTYSTTDFFYQGGDCSSPAESYSWSQWQNSFGQDANGESYTTSASFDFVGASLPSLTAGDYALEGSSTGIDEGITVPLATTDYNGISRPQGAGWDVGAFEFNSGVTIIDSLPNQFTFTDVSNADTSTLYTTTINTSGFTTPCHITISGGSAQYQIGLAGPWVTTMSELPPNSVVRVRMTSSGSNSTAVACTVTVANTISDIWVITTKAAGGGGYLAATTAYINRVNNAGGQVIDGSAVNDFYVYAAANGINLDSIICAVIPKGGVIKDGSNNLSRWFDLGNQNHDLIQATGTSQPTWYADSVKFNGTSDFMAVDWSGSYAQPNTFCIAMNPLIFGTGGGDHQWDGYGSETTLRHAMSGPSTEHAIYAGTEINVISDAEPQYSPHLITIIYNSTDSAFVNGVLTGSGNAGTQPLGGLTVGSDQTGSAGGCSGVGIRGLFIYATTGVKSLIEVYLASISGITLP